MPDTFNTSISKGKDKSDVCNYRPISLLSCISKIFEKIVTFRMRTFISENNLLSPKQHGFRPGFSTSSAVIRLSDYIYESMNEGKFAAGLFIDLSKAFDYIDHKILLQKLEHYGFRGEIGKLLQSYLMNRTFYTMVGNAKSTEGKIRNGVPQGSVLGPLLFSLYINDLPNALVNSNCLLYADDTTIFNKNAMQQQLIEELQYDFNNIQLWFKSNY